MSSIRGNVIGVGLTTLSLEATFYISTEMASSFEVGDRFRKKLTTLLEHNDFSFTKELREELNGVVEKQGQATISFGTLRKLKTCLRDNGMLCCVVLPSWVVFIT